LQREVQWARRRYGAQLSVNFLPVPMCPRCNRFVEETEPGQHRTCEYARLALAVKTVEPALFAGFHDWLMEPEEAPRLGAAHQYAHTLVGPDALDRALASDQVEEDLQKIVRVYGAAGGGTLPKLVGGGKILNGEPNRETLCHFLEHFVGLKPPAR